MKGVPIMTRVNITRTQVSMDIFGNYIRNYPKLTDKA